GASAGMAARSESEAAPQQLLTYVFGPGADFGGMLVGALQRIESGGAIRIVEILFVARGSEPHELVAVSRAASSAGMIGKLISFRLEDTARAAETEQALGGPRGRLRRERA